MKTAFVLTGGGSLGAVQVGMLEELFATGLRPDFIVGVSAGALNGAFLARDPSTSTLSKMRHLWASVRSRDVVGLSPGSLLGVIGLRDHIVDSSRLRRLLERELGAGLLEDLTVPLHVVCADLASGAGVTLSAGSLIDAVLASAAIPGVFPPVTIGGRKLVDGAVASDTPIAVAKRLGAQRIVVLPCGFACAQTNPPRHAIGRAMHAITLLGARQLRIDHDRYGTEVRLQIVPPLCPLSQSAYDYSHGAQLIDRARAATRQWLDDDGLSRVGFPDELIEHSHPGA